MKNVLTKIAENKNVIIKRSLIIGGTVVGLALTAGLISKISNTDADDLVEAVAE